LARNNLLEGQTQHPNVVLSEKKLSSAAAAATTFVASLPIPLEIKAPATALATTVTGAILLYWKSKVNKR
jgi:hypothetical protein